MCVVIGTPLIPSHGMMEGRQPMTFADLLFRCGVPGGWNNVPEPILGNGRDAPMTHGLPILEGVGEGKVAMVSALLVKRSGRVCSWPPPSLS